MKIKISKTKWNRIGRFAGWVNMNDFITEKNKKEKGFDSPSLSTLYYKKQGMVDLTEFAELVHQYLIIHEIHHWQWMSGREYSIGENLFTKSGKIMLVEIDFKPRDKTHQNESEEWEIGIVVSISPDEFGDMSAVDDEIVSFNASQTISEVGEYILEKIKNIQGKY